MSDDKDVNEVRGAALRRIERTERYYRAAFFGAALVEVLFLVGFVLLADFSNRTHVLLLLASVATYTIVGLGLFALAAHINRSTLRIVKAVELLASQLMAEGR